MERINRAIGAIVMTLGIVVILTSCGSDDPVTSTNSDGGTADSPSTTESDPGSTTETDSASQNEPILSVWPSGEDGDGALATGALTITVDACVYLDDTESGLTMLLVVPESSSFDAATQTIEVDSQTFSTGDVVSAGGSPRASTDLGPQCTDAEGYFFADTVFIPVS